MTDISTAGTFRLGDRTVKRMGYGAMQLAGPGVFGPPKDRDAAHRGAARGGRAAASTTSTPATIYGPHVTNQIIREALHPYPDDLVIVTKVGARRGEDGSWIPAFSRRGTDAARCTTTCATSAWTRSTSSTCASCSTCHGPAEGSIEAPLTALGEAAAAGARSATSASATSRRRRSRRRARIADIVCVQNHYNLAHRDDDALIDELAARGHRLRAVLPARRLHAAAVDSAVRCRRSSLAPRRCRWRSPGCCSARPTSC